MRLKKGCLIAIVVFIAFVISFFFICGEQLHYRNSVTDMLSPFSTVGEITSDTVIEQRLKPEGDMLTGLTLMSATFNRENTGSLVLEILNGNQILDSAVVEISGMVMRLAFSIATVVNPDILIVDEILAVGDAAFQEKSKARMMELMTGGTTVLFVSHNFAQIREMCDRVLWLEHGHMKMLGEAQTICDAYERG